MHEMDQNSEQQPKRIYKKLERSLREIRRSKKINQPEKLSQAHPPEKPAAKKPVVETPKGPVKEQTVKQKKERPTPVRKPETAGQFIQRVEEEAIIIPPIAGAQGLDPMLVARRMEERLCDLESQNKKITALKYEPAELLHAIDYEDLEDHARDGPEREQLREVIREFRTRINFNNEYLDFEAALAANVRNTRDTIQQATAMGPKDFGIFFRKPGVAEAFRELERRGEGFVTADVEQQNLQRGEIVDHLQIAVPGLLDPEARSAQTIAERLWRVTLRWDVYDPGFEHNDHFRSKRILHLEEFTEKGGYRENIENRHLLVERYIDRSTGEERTLGDLRMRDFFTRFRSGPGPAFETMGGVTDIPDDFYTTGDRDYGRRHLSLANADLENFDWENRVFEGALQNFWADMGDADETRSALIGEGAGDKAGLVQGPFSLEKVNDKLKDVMANARSTRPYWFMHWAEMASREKLSGWHYDNDRTVEMANTIEEHTEGLQRAGRESAPSKNLNLEKLWNRYLEETGLSRRMISNFGELPSFDVEESGVVNAIDVFENIKRGNLEITPEGVARLLLNIHDKEVILGAFGYDENTPEGNSFYQTLKYFSGVVELNDGRLVPIELLERGDLGNIIPQDLDRLNDSIVNLTLNLGPNNTPITVNESIFAVLNRILDHEDVNNRRDIQERLSTTNAFWQNAWQDHMNERNRILRLLIQGEFTVGSLRDIYENIYVRPLRRKLGFYNVPLLRRLFFWEEGKFAFDRQERKAYDIFDAYTELFGRLKNLRWHMGENAGQFIVAPEAPAGTDPYLAERQGMRPPGAGENYVLNRAVLDFEFRQSEPIFAFWLGNGMDNLDRFRKGWAGPILMYQSRFAMIERFFLKRSRKFLQAADIEDWQREQFEPGDVDLALRVWSRSPVGISKDQKADLARRLGSTTFDQFFYQFKKLFWGIADESKGETEHPLGKGVITGFGTITGFLAGRAAPVVRFVQYLPIMPTSFPDTINGFLIGGALQAVGIPLFPAGFFIGVGISKGYGTTFYQNGPSGWWRAGARNAWRLKNIRIPIVRHLLLPIAAMSAHDYIYDDETTVKFTQEDPQTGEGIKPLLSFKF